jgi:cyclohexanecarboxylate-CoA ligase
MSISATRAHERNWPELSPFVRCAPELLSGLALACGDEPAVSGGGISLTWSELDQHASGIAQLLQARGVIAGDVVAVQLPNWVETVASALAVWKLGAVLNPITPIYRGNELQTIFKLANPKVVMCPEVFGGTDYGEMVSEALKLAAVRASVIRISAQPGEFLSQVSLQSISRGDVEKDQLSTDSVSVLMFTSGTTGRPKGVLHSQRTLLYEASSIVERCNLTKPVVFMPSPLTHITGLLYGVLLPILTHSRVVLQDRWDAREAVDLIEDEGCTFSVGATPFLVGLTKEYRSRATQSTLAVFVCGGADVPPSAIENAQLYMGTTAVRAYGLTELPTLTCGVPAESLELRSGDDGVLLGSSEARVVQEQEGVGELEACGAEMFLGYLDPGDNAAAFTSDGWFRTGDLAVMTGSRIRIAGRSKDIIVRGGENLSPIEVENLLREMPGIADVAVVGVPDSEMGERACAMIVADGASPSLAEISDCLAASQLARQKTPEFLLLCDHLPRTASGKVQKYLLRREAAERLAAGEGERRC